MFKIIGIVLVGIHIFLGAWSLGGMIEWLLPEVPWKPYSNTEFPRWLLFFHWTSVLSAAGVFLYGYFAHWNLTPHFMAAAYAYMALVCVVETFGYMTNDSKYIAMALEYAAYIVILFILYNPVFREQHFS